MTKRIQFLRRGAYRGVCEFRVYDDSGDYMVEQRVSADPYEGGKWNYTPAEYERDVVGSIGILHTRGGARIAQETVDAFNAWQADEHSRQMAQLDGQPERYGVIAIDDPIRAAPMVARGGYWDAGWHSI